MFKSFFVVATLIASFSSAAPAEDTKPELERREPTYYSSSSYYGYRPSSYYGYNNNNNYGYTSYYKPTSYKSSSSSYSGYNSYKPSYSSYYLQKRDTIPEAKPELERREPTYYSSSSYYGYRPSSYGYSNNNNYGYTSYYKPTTYKSSGYSDYNSYKPKSTYGSYYYLQKRDTIPEAKPELQRREPTYYSSSSYYGYRPSSYGYSNNNNYGYTSYYKPTTYKSSSGYSSYNSYKPTYGSYYLQKRDTIPEAKPELERRQDDDDDDE
jgi:hypothetical protein